MKIWLKKNLITHAYYTIAITSASLLANQNPVQAQLIRGAFEFTGNADYYSTRYPVNCSPPNNEIKGFGLYVVDKDANDGQLRFSQIDSNSTCQPAKDLDGFTSLQIDITTSFDTDGNLERINITDQVYEDIFNDQITGFFDFSSTTNKGLLTTSIGG